MDLDDESEFVSALKTVASFLDASPLAASLSEIENMLEGGSLHIVQGIRGTVLSLLLRPLDGFG